MKIYVILWKYGDHTDCGVANVTCSEREHVKMLEALKKHGDLSRHFWEEISDVRFVEGE